jgi:hypothetical protein
LTERLALLPYRPFAHKNITPLASAPSLQSRFRPSQKITKQPIPHKRIEYQAIIRCIPVGNAQKRALRGIFHQKPAQQIASLI